MLPDSLLFSYMFFFLSVILIVIVKQREDMDGLTKALLLASVM